MSTKINIGIIGYGNLGKSLEQVILTRNDCNLVAIFSRRNIKSRFNTIVESYENIFNFKNKIDVMFLCGGSFLDIEKQVADLLLNYDCINSFDKHKKIVSELERLDKIAKSSKHRIIMSCGWDPGLFSNLRGFCYALSGETPITFWGKGISLGHSDAVRTIENVQDAVQFTVPNKTAVKLARRGKLIENECLHVRDVYVVAEKKYHKMLSIEIRNIPNYFKGQLVNVEFVSQEKLLKLKNKLNHEGEIISNFKLVHGSKCFINFKLKMSSNPDFTACIMARYIDAIVNLKKRKITGAFTSLDIPVIDLFKAEQRKKVIDLIC